MKPAASSSVPPGQRGRLSRSDYGAVCLREIYFVQDNRTVRGWKGPLGIILSEPPAKAGSSGFFLVPF